MKRTNLLPTLLLAALMAGAVHAEPAVTIRATELQSQAQSDAAVVATLPENTKLDVVVRKGAWSQVRTATGQSGWVRMLALRPEGTGVQVTPASASGNPIGALTGLLTTGRTSNTATVTTGVRGLSEEDLQNAQANPAELQKTQKFAVEKQTGQAFAQRSKLMAQPVEYLPEPAANAGIAGNANSSR